MSKVIFAVFIFCRPLLIALAPLNRLDLNSSRSRGGEEENENLLFFEELVLGAEGV